MLIYGVQNARVTTSSDGYVTVLKDTHSTNHFNLHITGGRFCKIFITLCFNNLELIMYIKIEKDKVKIHEKVDNLSLKRWF